MRHYKDYISQRSDLELAGIYADEGISGTQVGKRQDFQRLINDCVNGEIDYIVTKAIARFARNTLDTLKYVRMLKDMQIGVYFEEESIDTLNCVLKTVTRIKMYSQGTDSAVEGNENIQKVVLRATF